MTRRRLMRKILGRRMLLLSRVAVGYRGRTGLSMIAAGVASHWNSISSTAVCGTSRIFRAVNTSGCRISTRFQRPDRPHGGLGMR